MMSGDGTPPALLEDDCPVASFPYPESAARALGTAAARSEWLRRPASAVPSLDDVDADAGRAVVNAALADTEDAWLDSTLTRTLLQAYGIPMVAERLAASAEEAVEAARDLGLPAVVKSSAAGAHKTERGGVAIDLRDEDQVREAAERIGSPVIVQPHVRGCRSYLPASSRIPSSARWLRSVREAC
jgi:acyl-CoA synthetase (NDP forming)